MALSARAAFSVDFLVSVRRGSAFAYRSREGRIPLVAVSSGFRDESVSSIAIGHPGRLRGRDTVSIAVRDRKEPGIW